MAVKIYRATGISADKKVQDQIAVLNNDYGHLPVCIAKTQMSFSTDPSVRGAPSNHILDIREVKVCSGAGFIVVVAGNIMTMPGLPKVPSAEHIDIDGDGRITGLF